MEEVRKNLEETLREQIEKKGYELIEIEQHSLRKGIKMVLFIDHENGIGIDDCISAISFFIISSVVITTGSFAFSCLIFHNIQS